ncbi:hypothetical protein PoB_001503900 [Plakobranchus ocellatus]|uniref:Uncharacterized protein n=1 Tax=Plakobranchus ocellatus TaxID=259542 RepID=A0AAV3Z299_9GAST|nr:hypothetical protein PoB_001503900 [Plakobranchus ocellatus]
MQWTIRQFDKMNKNKKETRRTTAHATKTLLDRMEEVYIKDMKSNGQVESMHHDPRSYIVRLTNSTPTCRHRRDLAAISNEDDSQTPPHEAANPQTEQPEREESNASARFSSFGRRIEASSRLDV